MLSNRCQYALRAALYLAAAPPEGYVSVREIATALALPQPFLSKIAQSLTQAGLLVARRGPDGGLSLARPPEAISLREIVVAIDGPGVFVECVLGLPGCSSSAPCPLHDAWSRERARLDDMFREATLERLAEAVRSGSFRLRGQPAAGEA